MFNSTTGNLAITDGTRIGLRKDLNGIYLLETILQPPLQDTRNECEIVVEMTLQDVSACNLCSRMLEWLPWLLPKF